MSNRLSVLTALDKHGKSTYGDLEFNTGLTRKQLLQAVNDAKKAGHIDAGGKDQLTGQPTYMITAKGLEWMAAMPQTVEVKLPIPTAVSNPVVRESRTTEAEATLRHLAHLTDALGGEMTQLQKAKAELETAETAVIRWLDLARKYDCNSIPELRVFIGALEERINHLKNESNLIALNLESVEGDDLVEKVCTVMHERIHAPKIVATDAAQFVVKTPSKPPRFTKKQTNAHAVAMSAARQHGFAEVFALVPVGKAVRGAEWVAK